MHVSFIIHGTLTNPANAMLFHKKFHFVYVVNINNILNSLGHVVLKVIVK